MSGGEIQWEQCKGVPALSKLPDLNLLPQVVSAIYGLLPVSGVLSRTHSPGRIHCAWPVSAVDPIAASLPALLFLPIEPRVSYYQSLLEATVTTSSYKISTPRESRLVVNGHSYWPTGFSSRCHCQRCPFFLRVFSTALAKATQNP